MSKELRVLIIEDCADDAQLVVHELENAGFQVVWDRVQRAEELKESLNKKTWDIILSDYSMPQFNAIDALEIIKELTPDLPSIIISGTIGEDVAVQVMQAGAQDFFVKGKLARLTAAVRRQLTEAENIRKQRQFEFALRESEKQRWAEHEITLQRETESRKKIEFLFHEAQESNRLKEEFLTTLSHELRTPMNAITGWAELLINGECEPEEYPMAFATIHRNAQAENKLIDDLLDLSRILTGRLVIEAQPVELPRVVQSAIESLQLSADAKKIRINLIMEPSIGFVMGDSQRLEEVIRNLLSNSVKFTPDGGRIDIEICQRDFTDEIKVTDTGDGIDSSFLPFIFDRFRQGDGGLTRKHGGLGLGLSIARDLVQLHGGFLEAHSEGLGKGATLTVKLPAMTTEIANTLTEKSSIMIDKVGNELRGLRILVVDDQKDSLYLISFMLKRHGADVIAVDTAAEAFRLLKERRPDVFLSDIEMPGKDGYELIRQIRDYEMGKGVSIPAAALTAHVQDEDIDRAKTAGFNLHISKPIDFAGLINAVVDLSGRKPSMAMQL